MKVNHFVGEEAVEEYQERKTQGMTFQGAPCTLDGRPARIGLHESGFARVYTTDGAMGALSYEWSWFAVKHVMEVHGGAFQS